MEIPTSNKRLRPHGPGRAERIKKIRGLLEGSYGQDSAPGANIKALRKIRPTAVQDGDP